MTQTTRRFPLSLTSFDLRLLAMLTMLADHVAKTLVLDSNLTAALGYLGRLAFPIFAFQIVEGYFHTHSFKQYCKRLLVFALLSEIPYNLIMGLSSPINPFHQNVLWTFLIGLLVIRGLDRIRERFPQPLLQVLGSLALVFVGYGIGNLAMVDATCSIDIQTVKGVKNVLFGGEGLFNTVVTGPGKIILQTMPVSGVAAALAPFFPSGS